DSFVRSLHRLRDSHPRCRRQRTRAGEGPLMPTTYVLSLGNVLMSDDGLGPAVLRAFEQHYVVGPDVLVEDLGTPGLDLSPWLADAERVILIDTVKAPLPPGSIRLYGKVDLLGR